MRAQARTVPLFLHYAPLGELIYTIAMGSLLVGKTLLSTSAIFVLATVALIGVSVSANAAVTVAHTLHYDIEIDESLRRLDVDLCVRENPFPERLVASAELSSNLNNIRGKLTDGSWVKLKIKDRIVTVEERIVECVSYTVSVRVRGGSRRSGFETHNDAVVMALERLLLRPQLRERWGQTRLHFRAPPKVQVSAPGSIVSDENGKRSYELLDRPIDWDGSFAFGRLTQSLIEVGGAKVRLSIVGRVNATTTSVLHDWLVAGIEAVKTVYGDFPVERVQVLVFPLGPSDDPVPWGEVKRGGGDAVHLYVDGTRRVDELNANWVLAHELSHLLHPYISGADAWLPEGIASYYQNVVRARSALLDEHSAWNKLDAGFKRGRAQFGGARTLASDTRDMMREYQYMRVYWSGAAIALIGDVELRHRSGGVMSLDTVMAELSRCCLPSEYQWSAAQIMAKIDDITGYNIFVPLYDRYVMQPKFPELKETYRRLGLKSNAEGIHFSNDPVATKLRKGIMGRRATTR